MDYKNDLVERSIYLNTAYTGLTSDALQKWRTKTDNEFTSHADHFKSVQAKIIETSTRKQMATFLDAKVSETFLTTSCSAGLQSFLFKIPKACKFLLLEDDYPAIKQIVAEHQFEYTEISLRFEVELSVIKTLREGRFQVFAFSAVQYNSGLLFDMNFLKLIKKEFPNLIILVDGTQLIGAEPFSFNQSAVDGIFGSGYKWLLAGHGNGFMCIKESLMNQLETSQDEIIDLLDRGHKSPLAIGSLGFAVDQLISNDFTALLKKKKELSDFLFLGLKERGLLEDFVAVRKHHSSIFTIKANSKVFEKLIKENIRCIQRGIGVRVSVHFYNTQQDLDKFFRVLDQTTK